MKNIFAVVALTLASCSLLTKRADSIQVDSFRPSVALVCARQDAYVRADPLLSPAVQAADLEDSAELLDALSKPIDGEVLVGLISQQTRAVCARHDLYVKVDPVLNPLERDIFLRSSELVLRVINQAESGQ